MASTRIGSLDMLRGLVMVLMALDHVRDFFGQGMFSSHPLDLDTTTPALFLTRWITHFCAPVFVFLAGSSAFLYGRTRSTSILSRFLWTRGLWLVLIEVLVVRFGWQFVPGFGMIFLQVIWAIGISMLALAGLVWLPKRAVLFIGLLVVLGHNAFDAAEAQGLWADSIPWMALHAGGFVPVAEGVNIFFAYPVLPWIGVMALGFAFGSLYDPDVSSRARVKWLVRLGAGSIALFLVLRLTQLYGEPDPWSVQRNLLFTVLSVLDCTKYPPSLLYLCMTLGPAMLVLAWADGRSFARNSFLVVFGRVPFFFYIIHIYVIHALAVLAIVASGYPARMGIITPAAFRDPSYAEMGFDLWVVYAVWIAIVLALFVPCRWYAGYKAAHPEKAWLSYL